MKIINGILKIIIVIGSIYYSIPLLQNQNLYGVLIKLSIILFLFIPRLFRKWKIIDLSNNLEFLYLMFLFAAHFLGSIVDFYHKVPNYDTWMHFISGFIVAVLATLILKANRLDSKKYCLFNFLFIISFSCLIASSWEFIEFTGDKLFGKDAQNVLTTGVNDTMKDMIVATLASIMYGIVYCFEKTNGKKGIIYHLIN